MVRFSEITLFNALTHFFISGKASGDKPHKDKSTKNEDSGLNEKVIHLIEVTQKSEDQVCLALHESDYDMSRAVDILLANPEDVSYLQYINIISSLIFCQWSEYTNNFLFLYCTHACLVMQHLHT